MKWSKIYKYSVNPEVFLDGENIDNLRLALVTPLENETQADSLDCILGQAQHWHAEQTRFYRDLLANTADATEQQKLCKSLLSQSTPMASILGCWLQSMSTPGVFEQKSQLQQMALLADDVGVGQQRASRYDEFKRLLSRFGLQDHGVAPDELPFIPTLVDDFFALPAMLLAMSRRSDFFGPELCGVDLVFRTLGTLPFWAALKEQCEHWIDWDRLDLSVARDINVVADPLATSRQVIDGYIEAVPALAPRINHGAQWFLSCLKNWNSSLQFHGRSKIDPEQAMADLIRLRSRDASVYHKSYDLGGCPLSGWFKESGKNPKPLMDAIAKSSLIRPGNSARSNLVNAMVGPRGKMFRIFRNDELATMRQWIDYLPEAEQNDAGADAEEMDNETVVLKTIKPGDMNKGLRPSNIRQAYYLLQGRAIPPQTRDFAVNYVNSWFADIKRSEQNKNDALPADWPEDGLMEWLAQQHDKHSDKHNVDNNSASGKDKKAEEPAEMPSKEGAIDSSLQLAPLILIDGGWLQGFTDIHLASSAVGFPLFEIFWDELGNGQHQLNHPKIYRDLLKQMGIDLPPTGSMAFSLDERMDDDSFRLPVLWLCMGKLPLTFLPEILGMNLAMELSGVGDGYLFASQFLKHHGFSTRFVDLHNTIDNVATGHSAWAANAIDQHMRTISRIGDTKQVAEQWQRVIVGFKSMTSKPSKISKRSKRLFANNRVTSTSENDGELEFFHHNWSTLELN